MSDLEDRIVAEAKTWVGVPYRDKGRDRFGVDCIGVPIKVAHALGLTSYDTTDYPRRPDPAHFLRELRERMVQVDKAEVDNGMVAVFREPRHPCHSGIVERDETGRLWLIHAYLPARKVVREALRGDRLDNMTAVFRYRREGE